MNKDQLISLVRTLFKVVGAALVTHGATKAASIVNSEDVIGLAITIAGLVWSHFEHAPITPVENPPAKNASTPPVAVLFLVGALASMCLASGCAHLNSVTTKETDKQGVQREHTQVSVYTFWDANSELAKFKNSITEKTTGTTIGGISQESTSTNVTSQVEAIASGVASGVVKGLKP